MTPKRVTLFAGHYGSGKTNIAVNYAKYLRSLGKEVTVCDLDIVNPYFRTKDSEKELNELGIRLIASEFANSNVDLPALPSSIYGCFEDKSRSVILDVGGDDRGALALGRYVPMILEENDYEMIFVANFYRPLTPRAEDAAEVMREIEYACGIRFTAIADNSNLGAETTLEDVKSKATQTERLSEMTGLPILFTCAEESVAKGDPNLFSLHLQSKYYE